MLRMVFGGKYATFKPVRHPTVKQEQFSNYTMNTLGSGDVLEAVKLPPGEDLNEWLAANTCDFFNEIKIIWEIITEIGVEAVGPGEGFPPGYEYRWADSRSKTPTACSGPQYVEHVMHWVEGELNNPNLFPTSSSTPFPKNFIASIKVIYTRIYRIYAIVYTQHFHKLDTSGAVSHLNTSFKHFLYFIWEYDLVAASELDALQDLVQEISIRYNSQKNERGRESSISKERSSFVK